MGKLGRRNSIAI